MRIPTEQDRRSGELLSCAPRNFGVEALEEIPRLRRRDLPGDSIISPYTEDQRNMVREWTQ